MRVYQTRYHILAECPQYEEHRHILRNASQTLFLPEILGTDDGLMALAHFLEKSGAFTKTGAPRVPRDTPTLEEEEATSDEEGWDEIYDGEEEEEEEEEEE
ncbi:hypothetical protein PLICRDRAFT_54444 [Plicaturopsis crispa FD-325 SS-3]|nr:hypothetical protein PLICRDRAFT_54444 [Plicaturopsis crispa FD-325 SS-3]